MARAWRGRVCQFPLGERGLPDTTQTNKLKLNQGPRKCCFSTGKRCIPGTQAGSEALILGPLTLRPESPLCPRRNSQWQTWRGRGAGVCLSPQGRPAAPPIEFRTWFYCDAVRPVNTPLSRSKWDGAGSGMGWEWDGGWECAAFHPRRLLRRCEAGQHAFVALEMVLPLPRGELLVPQPRVAGL